MESYTWLANFLVLRGTNLRVIGKQRNWQWIVPQNVGILVSVTLLGLVRISKTRYPWKHLSLLTLLLTAIWAQEGKYASFHVERKIPKRYSKGQSHLNLTVWWRTNKYYLTLKLQWKNRNFPNFAIHWKWTTNFKPQWNEKKPIFRANTDTYFSKINSKFKKK